ncbi:MAG: UDP-N-acetylenolpyruvoylglucosamine reductase [Candidatus Yonathbacteria bacterium RIFCSPHIGHO2_01_FULL_44_41]|uniref:UDP-N-acetylenolpyruvoylglucosamine reductase n=1 Tax=Candidatus Yonathbacteria bacterium RIFCSPHIGHO2_02_FULL_44_14 TaxID=1802724 RepID=A0A1G2SBY7_9BACT|nr:MAG: UDP-N-acetylenolpyruvoylglucosamine reductase [Candidatus Yonathbacteria bacterium RIFCSPHIGHO2_01_FULL_44_41]OHA81901.1 MAG: UDP-N-acetylenolpyruvoylglucosamine reductase [Candidatus Yonathbacteria bacterium RIFCSPHIGHO2_02_FULL_44_14]OHA82431.1 MAG: UDP-N-acetylenolpyruvoylglucosamine reductase [Candidatus Yonathbacteria bacterium RIFCSPLOWO2_01_FULL_43_20]
MALHILEQVPLAPFTTMHVGGNARFFVRVKSIEDLQESILFARAKNLSIFILGSGSNILVSGDGYSGLVIKIELKGITYENSRVTAGAGEVWDEVVRGVVQYNLWGIENLSLVPGTVGGASVQNIGAYGVEACDTIFSVEALDTETMQIKTFLRKECEFGYRESIFKKNKNLIVVSVSFELTENGVPRVDYEDVKKYFEKKKVIVSTLVEIREAIVAIRTRKMPAPSIGTAGSFFKNPIVEVSQYEALKIQFPGIKAYPQGDSTIKLSAAWLLDHVGKWCGVRRGDAGVYEKQALILVNYGKATAEEILSLAHEMRCDIKEKTNVLLEEEVVML